MSDLDIENARQWLPLQRMHKDELLELLNLKNGFYAFESALHVFPFALVDCCDRQDLLRWNATDTWKFKYDLETQNLFCFAEDIFGYQFSIQEGRVGRFDPETGDIEDLCATLEEWAALMCDDFDVQTGLQIARAWQATNGAIQIGNRLTPIYPFITSQGTYELSNLYEVNAIAGMLSRADFARQVKAIPDGDRIQIVPTNVQE